MNSAWQFWIDRGGTFTDVVGLAPDGSLHLRKQPSADDGTGIDPGLVAAQQILGSQPDSALRNAPVASFKVGTTVATNALLEQRSAPTVFVTTRGFADALQIGSQHRPDIFALDIQRPRPLYQQVLEVDERIGVDGAIIQPLDVLGARSALLALHAQGWRAVAIALLHGWQHTTHERQLADICHEIGFDEVSVAHELVPLARYVPRASTTVLNAALAPVLRQYVQQLTTQIARHFPGAALHFMQSSGGLVEAGRFRALASVLSGPAGGLIGMSRMGAGAGFEQLIGFDMGGTSTDVALYDRDLPRRFEHAIAGSRITAPMLDVHTIAAGGGSVLSVRDGRLAVGPDSAGADPGPACYGRGGPATLTDIQVLLGHLQPQFLPQAFGPRRNAALDPAASAARIEALAAGLGRDSCELAAAFLEVAVETMANAIRHVSTRQGLDPADFTLFAFGGAAAQHALRVAAASGMRRVLLHPLSSVLSAVGIGIADWLETRRAGLGSDADAAGLASAASRLDDMETQANAALRAQGLGELQLSAERVLELRTGDSEVSIDIALTERAPDPAAVQQAFTRAYQQRFGHAPSSPALRIDAVRVTARAARPALELGEQIAASTQMPLPPFARAWFGEWLEVPVVAAAELATGILLAGPALVVEPHSTLVLEPGWTLQRLPGGALLAEPAPCVAGAHDRGDRSDRPDSLHDDRGAPDPARLEIFSNLFMHIAEEMGAVLQQTAQSVNIKERLDFSCALFDRHGGLVANAPHMPVHLGSMGASVRAVIDAHAGDMRAGDAWMLNSPYHGGTHLPDITVVTPLFFGEGPAAAEAPAFFVASRAHHADIGGITPGSMPPFSSHIDEEGVLFCDFQLLEGGRLRETALREALGSAPHPARNIEQNLADLRAQLAANERGRSELQRAIARHGLATLQRYMQHVQDNATQCVRAAIRKLHDGHSSVHMDGGQQIVVAVHIDRSAGSARIDFSGSSPQAAHNFHAPRAVCLAAVLYVFRTLVERPIPLNEGCLEPLEIIIPPGSMLDPLPGAAVVAGNVETSQCIVDALYAALGVLAASQGTMNNFTFGDAQLQYYETICGGAGAGPTFAGCDAVQTHMTNSRLTDVEVLEQRYPVRVRRFAVRDGSGGAGLHRGGHGGVREIEFLAELSGAMLANRRLIAPQGLAGGGDGASGTTRLLRKDGTIENLAACAQFSVQPGDRIEICTPGGGGFGTNPS